MRSKTSARGLVLAVACLSAFEAGCTTNGGGHRHGARREQQSVSAQQWQRQHSFDRCGERRRVRQLQTLDHKAGRRRLHGHLPRRRADQLRGDRALGHGVLDRAAGRGRRGPRCGRHRRTGQRRRGGGRLPAPHWAPGLAPTAACGPPSRRKTSRSSWPAMTARIQAAEMENDSLKGSSDRLRVSVDTLTAQLDQLEADYAKQAPHPGPGAEGAERHRRCFGFAAASAGRDERRHRQIPAILPHRRKTWPKAPTWRSTRRGSRPSTARSPR